MNLVIIEGVLGTDLEALSYGYKFNLAYHKDNITTWVRVLWFVDKVSNTEVTGSKVLIHGHLENSGGQLKVIADKVYWI